MTSMLSKRRTRYAAATLASAMALAACGGDTTAEPTETDTPTESASPSETASESESEMAFAACQVTDTGGVDDRSFNQTAYDGILRAEDDLAGVTAKVAESGQTSDFEPNINAFLAEDCGIIVTVGFLLGDATEAAALANPDTNFAIVDFAYETSYDNLRVMVFNTDEAAFLAGYAAASATETGVLGTYGGINIPPVTIFMDGFLKGMNHYNDVHDASVELKGWDGSEGLFTGDFEDQDKGKTFTETLIDGNADIIMPVAGPVGLGSLAAARENDGTKIVWVDTDGCLSTDDCDLIFTSVQKKMDNAVFAAVEDALDGEFASTFYAGTLANDGVGIAPFTTFPIDADIETELAEIRQQIIDGELVLADL